MPYMKKEKCYIIQKVSYFVLKFSVTLAIASSTKTEVSQEIKMVKVRP